MSLQQCKETKNTLLYKRLLQCHVQEDAQTKAKCRLTSRITTFAVWSLSFQVFFVSGTLHAFKYVSCCNVMLLMIYWLSCWPADRSGRRAGVPPPLHHHPRTPRKLIKRSRTTFSRFFFVHNPSSAGKLGSLCISIVHTPSPAGKHRWSSKFRFCLPFFKWPAESFNAVSATITSSVRCWDSRASVVVSRYILRIRKRREGVAE